MHTFSLTLLLELCLGSLANDGPDRPQTTQQSLKESPLSAVTVTDIRGLGVTMLGTGGCRLGGGCRCYGGVSVGASSHHGDSHSLAHWLAN